MSKMTQKMWLIRSRDTKHLIPRQMTYMQLEFKRLKLECVIVTVTNSKLPHLLGHFSSQLECALANTEDDTRIYVIKETQHGSIQR